MVLQHDQVLDFFNAHFTVRKYKEFVLPKKHLDAILHAAQRAPTDATAQMYSLIRLSEKSVKTKVAVMSGNSHIATASESFIICGDVYRLRQILESSGYESAHIPNISIHFSIGDAVLAGQNLLLAAELLGYRGCWIGGILNDLPGLASLLELPQGVIPFAGLTIGVPDEAPIHRPRLPRSMMVHENSYKRYSKDELATGCEMMAKITKRGDWAQTLNGYFGKNGTMADREIELKKFLDLQINFVD